MRKSKHGIHSFVSIKIISFNPITSLMKLTKGVLIIKKNITKKRTKTTKDIITIAVYFFIP